MWAQKYKKTSLMNVNNRLGQRYISMIISGCFRPYELSIQIQNTLYCKNCREKGNEVENTMHHFLVECPAYDDLRGIQYNYLGNHLKNK